jgi:hypothetical protein
VSTLPLSLSTVEGLAELIPSTSHGIYFLCDKGEVVYVGQSVYVPDRVADHKREKEFDSVFFLPVPRGKLRQTEKEFIEKLQPRLNFAGTKHPRRTRPDDAAATIAVRMKPELMRAIERTANEENRSIPGEIRFRLTSIYIPEKKAAWSSSHPSR